MDDDLRNQLEALLSTDLESWEVAVWLIGAVPGVPIYLTILIAVITMIFALVGRAAISKAAETQTDLAVKDAFESRNWDEIFARIIKKAEGAERGKLDSYNANWTKKLDQILEQNRGIERHRLRAASYSKLWACTKPLATYDAGKLDRSDLKKLSDDLTEWYFSPTGGMMLTEHVRELYFALQDLLRATNEQNWQVQGDAKEKRPQLMQVLRERAQIIKSSDKSLSKRESIDGNFLNILCRG